jgi:SAM-dependent methyltransferase
VNAEVTGAAYVEAMNRDPTDREYRRAFQALALTLVAPRGRVFDFGSGPGDDARHYAAAGFCVGAYDVNAVMCEYFVTHCAAELAAGSILLNSGSYADFLRSQRLAGGTHVDLIVANFAPLNLVDDLAPLFAKFAAMLSPQGRVLVSVLNPFFRGLRKSRRWWAALPRLLWHGRYTTQLHGVIPVTRWIPGRMALEASPHFELATIYAPEPEVAGREPRRVSLSAPGDWARIAATQFLFLEFGRRARA